MLQSALDAAPIPCLGAATGYSGAIKSGQTICGALYAGTVFLSCLSAGDGATEPEPSDPSRLAAIAAINALFQGFIERFGASDCRALTGLDLSEAENLQALFRAFDHYREGHGCFQQMRFVIESCLGQGAPAPEDDGAGAEANARA